MSGFKPGTRACGLVTGFILLFLLGCVFTPVPSSEPGPLRPLEGWLQERGRYQLQHLAEIDYSRHRENLRGFMELDLDRGRAHLIVCNSLGLTMLNLIIDEQGFSSGAFDHESRQTDQRERFFTAAVAETVRLIFLLPRRQPQATGTKPAPVAEVRGHPARLRQLRSAAKAPAWTINYNDYRPAAAALGAMVSSGSTQGSREFVFAPECIGFDGHFPEYSILPAMLQVELGIMLSEKLCQRKLSLATLDKAKFMRRIRPRQKLLVTCRLTRPPEAHDETLIQALLTITVAGLKTTMTLHLRPA